MFHTCSNFKLRTYQQEAVDSIFAHWDKRTDKGALLVMPTGTGKTVVFTEVVQRILAEKPYAHILILAHREILLKQAEEKLVAGGVYEYNIGYEMRQKHTDRNHNVCLSTMQTMSRRMYNFNYGYFDYIIIDEAHHTSANSYRYILAHFENARVLGVTATEDRGDGQLLAEFYTKVYEYTLLKAIQDGSIVNICAKTIPMRIDLRGVRKNFAGDYADGSLGERLRPMLSTVAKRLAQECWNRRTVVFLPTKATAEAMSGYLNQVGLRSDWITSDMKESDCIKILNRFASGELNIICNVLKLTEGWDCPQCDCIVPLRPTKSRPLLVQMIGRGTRTCPETKKTHCTVLDFLWVCDKHDIVANIPSLFTSDDEEIQEVVNMLHKSEVDVLKAVKYIQKEKLTAEQKRRCQEESLARNLVANNDKKGQNIESLPAYSLSIRIENIKKLRPSGRFPFSIEPMTLKKLTDVLMNKYKVLPSELEQLTPYQCTALFKRLLARQKNGLATYRQAKTLFKYGFTYAEQFTFEQARREISALASNNWHSYRGMNLGQRPEALIPRQMVYATETDDNCIPC